MELSMTVLRCPDQVAPEARSISGGEFHVGRGPDVDWVLPDPDRLLSKRHFAVAFRGGGWQVADTSTNGTYLNAEADAIGRGAARTLRDGDRLRLGAYEIEMRLVDQPEQQSGFGSGFGTGGPAPRASASSGFGDPFGDPFGDSPMAPPPPPRQAFNEPAHNDLHFGASSSQLPDDFDPLSPEDGHAPFAGGFSGPIQSDHSSAMEDAMIAPPIAAYVSPAAGGTIPGDDLLPDDWDKDLLEGIGAPQPAPAAFAPSPPAPRPAAPPAAAPAPVATAPVAQIAPIPDDFDLTEAPIARAPQAAPRIPEPPPFAETPAPASLPEASPFEISPFDTPGAEAHAPNVPAAGAAFNAAAEAAIAATALAGGALAGAALASHGAPVVRPRTPRPAVPVPAPTDADPFDEPDLAAPPSRDLAPPKIAAAPDVSPFDEPQTRAAPPPAVRPAPAPVIPAAPAAASADGGAALAAFFAGAELPGATPSDPSAMMFELGKAFRAVVSGLRAVLIARATIKSEFRIEQTMIRARGNNPLKFSANDDDALTALLGVGRRTDMAPAAAVEDSLRDIRMHEVAVMAAMQVAVRGVLDQISPDKVRATSDQGGMAVLPAQRKARAWDAFETRHAATVQALADDFDSVFGKTFAYAYERALAEISTRETQ